MHLLYSPSFLKKWKVLLLFSLLFSSCFSNIKSSTLSINPLFKINNLCDIYWNSSGQSDLYKWGKRENNIKYLVVTTLYPEKDSLLLNDTIFYNKSGYPIKWKNNNPEYGKRTYYYFQDFYGDQSTGLYVEAQHYDTFITVIQYESNHQVRRSMKYNQTRKEIDVFNDYQYTIIGDSSIHFKYTRCEESISLKEILPTYVHDGNLILTSDSTLQVIGKRTVIHDTTCNNPIDHQYKIKNNNIILSEPSYSTPSIQKTSTIVYYEREENELVTQWNPNRNLIDSLTTLMQTFLEKSWGRQNNATASFHNKRDSVEQHLYGDSITLTSAKDLKAFTPALWYQITSDTGYLDCYKSQCVIVAYNTPVPKDEYDYKRCLAIYQYVDGEFTLIDQYMDALGAFTDQDNDLLFDRYDETNISVEIRENTIYILYEYMRGSTDYLCIYKNNTWVLNEYSYSGNSYDSFSRTTYNYSTKKLTEERVYHGEEEIENGDTTIIKTIQKPVILLKDLCLAGDSLY
ncbi:MAG: hypothetical protein U0U66_12705 [Cytophagaceae bacterium]